MVQNLKKYLMSYTDSTNSIQRIDVFTIKYGFFFYKMLYTVFARYLINSNYARIFKPQGPTVNLMQKSQFLEL